MNDIGLLVCPGKGTDTQVVSAMLPDESEIAREFDVYDQAKRSEFIAEVAKAYQLPTWVCSDLHEEILNRAQQVEPSNKSIEKFSLGRLVKRYPELKPPVIHGFLREGEVGNIVSIPKVGKSWGAYQLGISVVMGWEWLGKFEVEQGRVLLVDNELHRETLAQRIPKVAAAIGESRGDFFSTEQLLEDFHVMSLRGNLRTLEELGAEFDKIERGYYKLIIFDAKYRFALDGVSENDNAAETLVANLLDRYGAKTNAALLLIHHSSKGSQSDKRVTDVGSGAGAQSRAADCHMVLREHEEDGLMVLDAAVRSFPPVQPVALRWDFPLWVPDETADVTMLKGKKTKNEERQSERDKEGFDKIIVALADGTSTARQLRSKTGLGKDRQQRLLDQLSAMKQITVTETTIRGNQCHEYSLAESENF